MNANTKDGGPALVGLTIDGSRLELTSQMSIRAYIAAQAMLGILSSGKTPNFEGSGPGEHRSVAIYACRYADAMMAELERYK